MLQTLLIAMPDIMVDFPTLCGWWERVRNWTFRYYIFLF